jgi:hypothetical protein
MNRFEIIRQPALIEEQCNNVVRIFGKGFSLPQTHNLFRIVLHEDFPMIDEGDLRRFVSYSVKQNAIVLSGCKAEIHPYRLMYISEKGYDECLVDIPNIIRGNRHWYPETFHFVPALISIPPNIPINSINNREYIKMYIMPKKKLLDNSNLLDRLLIFSLQQSDNSRYPRACAHGI